ncbi:hypothetical protein CMQ_201 [Grosmannia clavigera kw1407]|uniref:Uncharacterized protein n=1 Tax=Grosmannia clavigera (strain kw1407 / UAMH 11150) TaxID=655863 RepID=F0XRF2_GROCL|nr:uncharacterized protein CMQ_201 [Grosmannia clavigera kw1407]EFW99883.1 hypothetical protein CMQ_201 [Grosmannia clavigera kw1407]
MTPLERFSKWVQLKIYQTEVTYSVYIFTPAEKFVFYSVVFLLFALTSIATFLYLPRYVAFLIGRAWFYAHGDTLDASTILEATTAAAGKAAEAAATVVREL